MDIVRTRIILHNLSTEAQGVQFSSFVDLVSNVNLPLGPGNCFAIGYTGVVDLRPLYFSSPSCFVEFIRILVVSHSLYFVALSLIFL